MNQTDMIHYMILDTGAHINLSYMYRAETWVLALGGYGATMPDKLDGALVSPDDKHSATIKLISIKLYS